MVKQWHTEVLPARTKRLMKELSESGVVKGFYLSGGTGLALRLGHRESEDLDFFRSDEFQPVVIQRELEKLGKLEQVMIDKGTLNLFMRGVELQFLHYPYRLLGELNECLGVKVSSVLDIGCTKLQTIAARGSKKDFIDLYFVLRQYDLEELFKAMQKKYAKTNYNQLHILKSLSYFADAEKQPMPRMHERVDWEVVKNKLKEAVKSFKW